MEPWEREAEKIWSGWKADGTHAKYRGKRKAVAGNFLELKALMKAIYEAVQDLPDPDAALEQAEEMIDPALSADENCQVIADATHHVIYPVIKVWERPRAVARASAKAKRELPKVEGRIERWFELKPEERREVEKKVEELEKAAETATPLPADLTSELWKTFSQFPGATEEAFREWAEREKERIPKMPKQEIFTSIRAFLEEYRARRYAEIKCPYCHTPLREAEVILGIPVPPEARVYLFRCTDPSCIAYGHIFLFKEGKLREVLPKDALRLFSVPTPRERPETMAERLFRESVRVYSPPATPVEERDFERYLADRGLTREEFDRWPDELKWPVWRGWRDNRWVRLGHGS